MFAYEELSRKSCEIVAGVSVPTKARLLISLRMEVRRGQRACMWQPTSGSETLNGAFPPACGGPINLMK